MKIIDIENIKDSSWFNKQRTLNGVSFLSKNEINIVLQACGNNVEILKRWFDMLNIKYDDICIVKSIILYTVDGEELLLSDLSSGERYLLYIVACNELKLKIVAKALFERLDSKLTPEVIELIRQYKELVVITYNRYPIELKECIVREVA